MPRRSPFPARKPASSAVQQCPLQAQGAKGEPAKGANGGGASGNWDTTPVKPCDLRKIVVSLTSDGKTVTKQGTKPQASPPLPNVSDQVNGLLTAHAVVIHRAVKTEPSTSAIRTTGIGKEIGGTAVCAGPMKSSCGQHPVIKEDPEPETPADKGKISVSTTKWEVSDFGKMIFKGKPWRDFFYGDRKSIKFDATSCGAPASGDPVGSLTGIAQIAIADEWIITFISGKGISISVKKKERRESEYQTGLNYSGQKDSRSKESEYSEKSAYKTFEDKSSLSAEYDRYKKSIKVDEKTEVLLEQGAEAKIEAKRETSTEFHEDAFTQDGRARILAQAGDCFNFKVERNGETIFDPKEIKEKIDEFAEEVSDTWDRLARMKDLFQRGALAAIPVAVTFEIECEANFMKGSINARTWPEKTAPIEGATYYIEDFRNRFQLNLDLEVASLTLKPKVSAFVALVSKYIASIEIELEASLTGRVQVGFSIDDTITQQSVVARSSFPMSVAATGTGSALSYYLMAKGEMKSALRHIWTAEYNFMNLSAAEQEITNDRLSCELVVKRGNKVMEWFGLGEPEECYRWPEDGPFIWIEDNAMKQTWTA